MVICILNTHQPKNQLEMKRKIFVKKTVGAFLTTLVAIFIVGCSNSDDGTENSDPKETVVSKCIQNGALGLVTENHGHSLTIPKEDVIAAKDKTYNIQGFADHDHTLTLTSGDFSTLKNTTRGADIYSSTENEHRHSVFISCAP